MKTKFVTCLSLATIALSLLANTAKAIDLLQRYPTQLTQGDAKPENARPWAFTAQDIFRLSQFNLKVGERFKVETGAADLAIGHCSDGVVWAVVLPREHGTLTSPVADKGEAIANVWLRFHPSRINDLFPPDTVFGDGNTNLERQIRAIVRAKFRTSWHAGMNAMIPPPKDMTVYVDTKDGAHRFFMVDTEKQTAEYVAAFNRRSRSSVSPDSIPPVVIKTVPESGSTNVPPGEFEIKVTFSKKMMTQSWSWCDVWEHSTPEGLAAPKYDASHRTCMLKVKLEPNKAYGYWLNTERHRHFQDPQHHPAVPYLLTFKTSATPTGTQPDDSGNAKPNQPQVLSVSPANGATNVECVQNLCIRFDQPMKPDEMQIQWEKGGFVSTGNYHYEPNRNEFVIPVQLLPGRTNDLNLNSFGGSFGGFKNTNGVTAKKFHWHFTTRPLMVKTNAPKPKVVNILPAAGKPTSVLTFLEVTFDQPMLPPDASVPYLKKNSVFERLPAVIPCFGYDSSAHRFVIPLAMSPDNPVKVTLDGFYSSDGVASDPVVCRFDVGTNDFSASKARRLADAAKDPRLGQLLAAMKQAREQLNSGVESVVWKSLNADEAYHSLQVNRSIFKWQGTNQVRGDISDVMNSKAFILGSDGKTCWLYSESAGLGPRLEISPARFVPDRNISIADPFALTKHSVQTAIAEDHLVYLGEVKLAGRKCHHLQSWTVHQPRNKYDQEFAARLDWWIDAETDLPRQLAEYSTYGSEIFTFSYSKLNQPLPDSEFQPPLAHKTKPDKYTLFKQTTPAPDEKRFLTIRDGADGRMSGRIGYRNKQGSFSSGLN